MVSTKTLSIPNIVALLGALGTSYFAYLSIQRFTACFAGLGVMSGLIGLGIDIAFKTINRSVCHFGPGSYLNFSAFGILAILLIYAVSCWTVDPPLEKGTIRINQAANPRHFPKTENCVNVEAHVSNDIHLVPIPSREGLPLAFDGSSMSRYLQDTRRLATNSLSGRQVTNSGRQATDSGWKAGWQAAMSDSGRATRATSSSSSNTGTQVRDSHVLVTHSRWQATSSEQATRASSNASTQIGPGQNWQGTISGPQQIGTGPMPRSRSGMPNL